MANNYDQKYGKGKGYYRALRQNRKILNRRLRSLDNIIGNSRNENESLNLASSAIRSKINTLNTAKFWRRLFYAVTGDMGKLLKEKKT